MAVRLNFGAALVTVWCAGATIGSGADAQMPCRVLDLDLSVAYKGECKSGLAEGYGEAKGAAQYQGEFRAGRKHGTGTYVGPAGDVYRGRWANGEPIDAPTPQMIWRARMGKEREVALAKPGTKVCRSVTVGIAEQDWIRGMVIEVERTKIAVRIDDPGRFSPTVNGILVQPGTVLREGITAWEPCL